MQIKNIIVCVSGSQSSSAPSPNFEEDYFESELREEHIRKEKTKSDCSQIMNYRFGYVE